MYCASEELMKTKPILSLTLLAALSLSLAVIPCVTSQPENIKVVSYNWYIDSLGFFVVVGEIQNIGSSTVDTVGIGGTVYTVDGTAQADSYTQAYVKYLIPQQKAVFYMEFSPTNDATGETWIFSGIDRVDFTIVQAEKTSSYQYPDLTVKASSATIGSSADDKGVYWVSGTVQNIGNQTAKSIRVIGTFYNASNTVVAMGYTDPLTPTSLNPSGTASFKLGAFDLNQTEVPSNLKIASYSLLIQTEEPVFSGTPPPPSNTTQTPPIDNSEPSTDPSDSNPSPWSTYAIVAIVAILGLIGTAIVLKKRNSQLKKKRKMQVQRQQPTSKKKR